MLMMLCLQHLTSKDILELLSLGIERLLFRILLIWVHLILVSLNGLIHTHIHGIFLELGQVKAFLIVNFIIHVVTEPIHLVH